jgi:hypothetical protein
MNVLTKIPHVLHYLSGKRCPDPGRPRNGNVKGLFGLGEKIYYTCDECYKLKGSANRQCQADEKWTDTQPTCECKHILGVIYVGESAYG